MKQYIHSQNNLVINKEKSINQSGIKIQNDHGRGIKCSILPLHDKNAIRWRKNQEYDYDCNYTRSSLGGLEARVLGLVEAPFFPTKS